MSKTLCHRTAGWAAGIFFAAGAAHGVEAPPKFLGANSCASSMCHGGGGAKQNQFLVWSLRDFHSQRPVATLATARSKQIADALDLKDPAASPRCTLCHAPLDSVPPNRRGEKFQTGEGVSCESCHGPAEHWLRGHTRPDWTRADRTAAGMRDLQNLYVRANSCVACHQNVDADLLQAGHPELIFELDGQSVAEPKHWSAEKNGNGAQAWLVGQAVALREMSWQVAREKPASEKILNRWKGLQWLLEKSSKATPGLPVMAPGSFLPGGPAQEVQSWSDQFARAVAGAAWSDGITKKILSALAGTSADFQDGSVASALQARRAERLVLALDRLVAAWPELKNNQPAQSALNQLFQLAQSLPDFDSGKFAAKLADFSRALGPP